MDCRAALIGLMSVACTGNYGGVDGGAVIARKDAVQRINDTRLARMVLCGPTSADALLVYSDYVKSDRKVLDGAYYTTRDVDRCIAGIWLTPCSQWPQDCGLSPNEFLETPVLQGGF
jgi:hypothetical protein